MNSPSPHLTVRPVVTPRERRMLLRFPWRIYRHDPLWVPPIFKERAARLAGASLAPAWIAWRGRQPVGTLAATVDEARNAIREESVAYFGFFECREDYPAAEALLDAACAWARAQGVAKLRGPQSFAPHDEPGILIAGRETPPGLMMGWSPPYYQRFVERYGGVKFHDTLAYRITMADYTGEEGTFRAPPRMQKVAEYVQRRYGDRLCLRTGDLEHFEAEMERARAIYNLALAHLSDFTPISAAAWQQLAASLRTLLDARFAVFLELDGEDVAFALALPDISHALWHCNGLRAPWDYLKLWWYSRRLPGISFKIMAMLPEHWGRGLDALLYLHLAEQSVSQGYQWMDLSLTGEDNPTTNKLAARVGARIDKRYRIYDIVL